MADASSEPKLAQTETELAAKPLHGDEKEAEAPKETSDAPSSVCEPLFKSMILAIWRSMSFEADRIRH